MSKIIRPYVHVVVMGPPGYGKSSFLRTMPTPALVIATDPIGKEGPYLQDGVVDPACYIGPYNQPIKIVNDREGVMIRQIEFFHDSQMRKPHAWLDLRNRLDELENEITSNMWNSVILDGVSLLELIIRKHHQYHSTSVLRNTKDTRRLFGATTDDLEEVIIELGTLLCNVGIACHVDEDKDETFGMFIHRPAAPGRLRSRNGFGMAYPELYYTHVVRDEENGELIYQLQTRPSTRYLGNSVLLEAPDPCEPTWEAIFANWEAKQRKEQSE